MLSISFSFASLRGAYYSSNLNMPGSADPSATRRTLLVEEAALSEDEA